jgi:intermediate peptidase
MAMLSSKLLRILSTPPSPSAAIFGAKQRVPTRILQKLLAPKSNNAYSHSTYRCYSNTQVRCLSTSTSTSTSTSRPGLFSLPNLHKPQDFLALANDAISNCNTLRETIRTSLEIRNESGNITLTPRETLHLLDDISNTVCSVIDASELCRSVHSSPTWRNSASSAFQMLSEYIAELNTDVSLYQSLVPITSSAAIMQSLNEEERRMAIMLQKEFERDAIHLSDKDRAKVQQLNGFVVQLESMFTENLVENKTFDVKGSLAEDVYRTIPKHVIDGHIPQNNIDIGTCTLSTEAHIANSILKYSPSANLRKEVYMEANTVCPQNLEILDALIQQRHALAVEMGYPSYAHYFLSDKMAHTPEVVMKFLGHVREASKDRYHHDLEMISKTKRQMEETDEPLQPWDMSYYSGLIKSHVFEGQGDAGDGSLAGYFTVEQSLEGMKILVQRLFGIQMKEVDMSAEERWDIDNDVSVRASGTSSSPDGIRRFEFFQEVDEKPLGTMYLDLHPRPGKYSHAAHFTVRCGCESRDNPGDDGAVYQLPIVALVCNVSPPVSNTGSAAVLSHSEVETLFHEFGHALHSLLSRTSFQHLSGTRVAMDFVETPSHLMEMYVWNEEFLNIIGAHFQTGASIPAKNIENLVKSRNVFKSMEVQSQCVYALFDQTIFGVPEKWATNSAGVSNSTTDIFKALHLQNGLLYADGTHWHSKFGHLVSYGAGYYSYLYASIFSADLWNTCFDGGSDAFSREAGNKYWKEILIHGGSKDPNHMLSAMLGRDPKVDPFFKSLG